MFIKNDEPGIDVQRSAIFLDCNRMGMATRILILLKERQLMISGQVISGRKTGNTTTNDCYVHYEIKSLNILKFVIAAKSWFVRLPATVTDASDFAVHGFITLSTQKTNQESIK